MKKEIIKSLRKMALDSLTVLAIILIGFVGILLPRDFKEESATVSNGTGTDCIIVYRGLPGSDMSGWAGYAKVSTLDPRQVVPTGQVLTDWDADHPTPWWWPKVVHQVQHNLSENR